MVKFLLVVVLLLLFGVFALGSVSEEAAGSFALFVFGIVVLAVILKVTIDVLIMRKEEASEREYEKSSRTKVKAIYNLEEYWKARNKQNDG